MRIFANAFLVAFAIDALFALAWSQGFPGFAQGAAGAGLLTDVRVLFTGLITLASLPLFVLMGIHPGYRWRIFLPPCLFLSWSSLGAMPLPIWFEASRAALISGVLEAAIAAMAFGFCRQQGRGLGGHVGRGWLLSEQALRGPSFSGRTAVGFTALNLLVILPASLAYLVIAAAAGVGHLTEGFVEIRRDGIYLAHREYARGDQTIHLVAMMHIGDAAFYQTLIESLPKKGAIMLAEGVTDDSGLLAGGMSYDGVASGLGLVEQPALGAEGRELRYADVDVSAFSSETLDLLRAVGQIFAAEGLSEALVAYLKVSDLTGKDPTRLIEALRHDLIELRNAHVIAELEKSLGDYDIVLVPWGALHLPGIQRSVRELGFVQAAGRDLRVISW